MTLLTDVMVAVEPDDPSPEASNDLVARQNAVYGGLMLSGLLVIDSLPPASMAAVPALTVTLLSCVAWVRWMPLAGRRLVTYWHTRQYALTGDSTDSLRSESQASAGSNSETVLSGDSDDIFGGDSDD